MPTNEAKAEIETQPVIGDIKISKFWCNVKPYKPFCAFYYQNSYISFLLGNNFLFYLFLLI